MNSFRSMDILVKIYRIESQIQREKAKGSIKKALALYDNLIQLKEKLPNRLGLAKSIAEKGLLLENSGFYDDALHTYHFAAKITKDSRNKRFKQILNQRIDGINKNQF